MKWDKTSQNWVKVTHKTSFYFFFFIYTVHHGNLQTG